ncbi:MAG: tetratricopeptide repeat protein [Candidatus Omnitrophota bacterium]
MGKTCSTKNEKLLLKNCFENEVFHWSKEIKDNPNNAEAYNNRGKTYGELGDDDKAISDFTKAVEVNPNYAEAINNRAVSYFYTKKYVKSWQDVITAEKLGWDTRFVKELFESKKAKNEVI